jgi:hypothetical protein
MGSDSAAGRPWGWLLVLAVAAPGVARDISVYFWKAGPLATTRSEDRFSGLSLPAGEKGGFLTDAAGGAATRRYFEALHALAPAILLTGPEARLVVADVEDPASIGRICAQWKLHVVQRAGPGTALLERD